MEKTNTSVTPIPQEEVGIEVIALIKKLWSNRRVIIWSVIFFALLGVVVALVSPKQYTSTCTIVPQLGSEGGTRLGGLGGLAALAGLNMDMTQQGYELSPIVYPQIIGSVPFQLELMNTPLNFQKVPQPVSLFDYLTKYQKPSSFGVILKYTIGLPNLIMGAFNGKKQEIATPSTNELNPIRLTDAQVSVQKAIDNMITLNVNPKEGYLTIIVNMEEPLATAQMALKAQQLLQKYITDFKIQKSQANLNFIESSYYKAKKEFEQAQVKLAVASDRSNGFVTGLAKVETDRLQSQYSISFSVYQELAKQYEQIKIQVKKETPVFAVVDPPVVPSERTNPKRSLIVMVFTFLGGMIGVSIVFGKEYWNQFLQKWKDEQ